MEYLLGMYIYNNHARYIFVKYASKGFQDFGQKQTSIGYKQLHIGHVVQSLSCHQCIQYLKMRTVLRSPETWTQIFLASTKRLTRPTPRHRSIWLSLGIWNRQVRPRRLSEPPRPDVACDKWKVVDYREVFLGTQRLGTLANHDVVLWVDEFFYVQKKSACCNAVLLDAVFLHLFFAFVLGRRIRDRRHPCMAKGAGQMRKMWWVVVSDPPTRLRQVVCVLRFNLFRWVLLRQTHVSSRPCLELPSDPCNSITWYILIYTKCRYTENTEYVDPLGFAMRFFTRKTAIFSVSTGGLASSGKGGKIEDRAHRRTSHSP